MRPVATTPPLPYPGNGVSMSQLAGFDQDLVRALYGYLGELSRRANAGLPMDGSDPMAGPLNMGGFDITNVGDLTVSGVATFTDLTVQFFDATEAVMTDVEITNDLDVTGITTVTDLVADTVDTLAVDIDGPAGTYRPVRFRTNGSLRWGIGASTEAEAGSNAGSNLYISRLSDAGGVLADPVIINRATGTVNLERGHQIAGVNQWETFYDGDLVSVTNFTVDWPLAQYARVRASIHLTLASVNARFYLRWRTGGADITSASYQVSMTGTVYNSPTVGNQYHASQQELRLGNNNNVIAAHPWGLTWHGEFTGFRNNYPMVSGVFTENEAVNGPYSGTQLSWASLANVHGFSLRAWNSTEVFSGTIILEGHR